MSEFEFSVIIQTHNSESGIEKSINSIINQTLDFNKFIEIIILNDNNDEDTEKICNDYIKKYPDNIKFFQIEDDNFSKGKNMGIQYATGKFITSLESSDYYSKNTFKEILSFINENSSIDIISIPLYYFKNGRKERYLNCKLKKTEKINLIEHPEYAELLGLSTFFKRKSAENVIFSDIFNNNITVFSEILINNPVMGICSGGIYYSNNLDEKIYPMENQTFSENDFEHFLKFNFKNLIEKSLHKFNNVPQFIQYNLTNHLRWLLSIEKTSNNLELTKLTENINYIEDSTILNSRLLTKEARIFSLLLKYNNDLNENLREKLELNTVFIDNYDIINNKLRVLASTINTKPRNIDVIINDKKITKKELFFPQKDSYILNDNFGPDYSIEFEVPLNIDKTFKLEFKEGNKPLHIDFSRPCNFSKKVGYAKTRHYISILNNDSIIIKKKTSFNWIKQELKSLIHIVKQHEPGFEKAIPFRILYMITYPILKNRKIWFYMDRPDESDDNGLALFKYSMKQNEDIHKYFILDSKSKDFNNIKKIGKVISYKSIKHRFLGMFVENIITSHPDNEIVYPFWGGYPFFAGLLKSNNIFLQHGILKDNISSWLNKSNMNLSLFLTSSPKEYESIFKYPYNYDEDIVQLLGLPRYDTLKNQEDKKQIIIMPSWRRDLDHKSKKYVKENEFFKKFNSLINNEKLIEKAKEKNYDIIFRPHPKVYEYIDLFDENNFVKIDYEKIKYQTLFNMGSIMITDYSSVAFDFAYLNKPVLYYHYGEDYHFDLDESYFDYETMGFGEIAKTEDELVNLVIEYINNDCMLKEKYDKRIKEFFLFNDRNNCKRVHDKIKEISLKD